MSAPLVFRLAHGADATATTAVGMTALHVSATLTRYHSSAFAKSTAMSCNCHTGGTLIVAAPHVCHRKRQTLVTIRNRPLGGRFRPGRLIFTVSHCPLSGGQGHPDPRSTPSVARGSLCSTPLRAATCPWPRYCWPASGAKSIPSIQTASVARRYSWRVKPGTRDWCDTISPCLTVESRCSIAAATPW